MRHLNTGNHRPNHIHKPGRFPIAQRTGTFVPLPTPLCGRRMPARKSPEGPSRSTSSTVPLDNINALHTRPSHIGRVPIWPEVSGRKAAPQTTRQSPSLQSGCRYPLAWRLRRVERDQRYADDNEHSRSDQKSYSLTRNFES